MSVTNCQSKYFKPVDGKLICVVCGEPAEKHRVETKERRVMSYTPESKRQGRKKK